MQPKSKQRRRINMKITRKDREALALKVVEFLKPLCNGQSEIHKVALKVWSMTKEKKDEIKK